MAYPTNYRYTKEHEWIALEGTIGTIGITDYAQNSLGDIVYVDAPKIGESVTANTAFGSVESVKAVSDLFSPVSGKVTAVNEELKTSRTRSTKRPTRRGLSRSNCPTRLNLRSCSMPQLMSSLCPRKPERSSGF